MKDERNIKVWFLVFFFNQQKFIKNLIPAQDDQRPMKYKQKALYIGGTPENKTPTKTHLRL